MLLPPIRDALLSRRGLPAWVAAQKLAAGSTPSFALKPSLGKAWAGNQEVAISSVLTCARTGATATDLLWNSASGYSYSSYANNVLRTPAGIGLIGAEEARTQLSAHPTAPANETITIGTTGAYVLWVNGSGSAAVAANSATGTGFGTATNGVPVFFTITATGTVDITVTGSLNALQVEKGAQATSFIPTGTRNAESHTVNNGVAYVSQAMTIFSQGSGSKPNSTVSSGMYYLDNSGNSTLIFARQTADRVAFFGRDAAAAGQWNIETSINAVDALRHRYVMSMGVNDIAICTEVGAIGTDTSATVPATTANRIGIGATGSAGGFWNGVIEEFAIWPTALTDLQCQVLSAINTDFLFLAEGDSIPAATGGYVDYIHSVAPLGWSVQKCAVGGSSLNSVSSALNIAGSVRTLILDAQLARYKAANPSLKHVTLINTGFNDLTADGANAATYLSRHQAYCDARRAVGHRMCDIFVTPSTTAGVNAFRATANAAKAAQVGVHTDYLVDLSAVSGCADADASNTLLYGDGIHPTIIGVPNQQATVIGAAVKSQVLDGAAA